MVQVTVRRDSQGRLSSLFASGHADWADEGTDVVCAAVAAILQAAWVGLDHVAKVPLEGKRGNGTLTLRWPESSRNDIALGAIVSTAEVAIEHLAAQYPDHVSLARETEH